MNNIKKILRQNYQIAEVQKLEEINKGIYNLGTYKVITEQKQYLLKFRPGYIAVTNLLSNYQFLDYLKKNDFPVPNIITSKKGNKLVNRGDLFFELQEYIAHQGDVRDYDPSLIIPKLASFLGEYHQLAAEYKATIKKSPYLKTEDKKYPINFQTRYFDSPFKEGRKYYQNLDSVPVKEESEINSYVKYYLDKLQQIQTEFIDQSPNIDKVVIHNDFRDNNILFKNDEIKALIDFDLCYTGIYYVDLIELLYSLLIWQQSELEFAGLPKNKKINSKQIYNILENYFAVGVNFNFDLEFCFKLLEARIIGQIFIPGIENMIEDQNKLEILQRLEDLLEELNNIKSDINLS